MSKEFISVIKNRRSIYTISKETTIPNDQIINLIQDAVKYTPTAFNSQSAKVIVLFGDNHNQLWDITMDTLKKLVPADSFEPTELKINGFKAGYGTVLFFDDTKITDVLAEQYSLYKEKFPIWAHHANGMVQFAIWNLLESAGLGASLQHYDPLIDEEVKKAFEIPKEWKLIAQMPFGKPYDNNLSEKEFAPIEDRVKIFE